MTRAAPVVCVLCPRGRRATGTLCLVDRGPHRGRMMHWECRAGYYRELDGRPYEWMPLVMMA